MDKDLTSSGVIAEFTQKLDCSPLLDVRESEKAGLELICSSPLAFFNEFVKGRSFTFSSFFSDELISEDDLVLLNGKKIKRKDRYAYSEIDSYIPHIALASNRLTSTCLPYFQQKALLNLIDKDDAFLSYGNVYYQKEGNPEVLKAPLVFFKVRISQFEGEYSLALSYNAPIYNLPLLWRLKKEHNIVFPIKNGGFDVNKLVITANEKLAPLSFSCDEGLLLIQTPVMDEVRLAKLVNYQSEMDADPVFNSFFNPHENRSMTTYASRKEHMSFIQDGLNQLAKNSLVKIDKTTPLSEEFLKAAMDETILHNGSVLALYENEEEEKAGKRKLIKRYYDLFMPYKNLSEPGTYLSDIFEVCKKRPYYAISQKLLQNQKEILGNVNEIIETDASLKAISLPTNESNEEIYSRFTKVLAEAKRTYDFSKFNSYDFSDAENDKDFLSFLSSSYFFRSYPFTRHPFYGLNSEIDKKQYAEIRDFLKAFKKDIVDFMEIIDESQVKSSKWSDFNSIRDFDEAVKMFQIYSRYDGFNLDYFKIDFTQELLEDIHALEECYRNEASIRLSLDVLCQPDIWSKDFARIVEDVKDHDKEKALKKEMKTIIKLTPYRSSFKTLIVFLDKFQDNHKKLADLRLKLEATFGKTADSLDGLLNVDSSYEFIVSYNRHKKLFEKLDFNNPFTENVFKNPDFSEKYRTVYYPSLMQQRSVIEADLDKFRSYFNEDKFDYVQNSFGKIIERLDLRILTSEDKFDEYLDFSKKADKASMQLRSALSINEKEETPLFSFQTDYKASLYRYLLFTTIHQKNGLQLMEKISKDEFLLYDQISRNGNILGELDIVKTFESMRSDVVSRPSFEDALGELKKIYHEQTMVSPSYIMDKFGDVFYSLFPLLTSSMGEGAYLLNQKFDLVVLDLRKSNSFFDLMSAFMMGRKVIVIGDGFQGSENIIPISLSIEKDLNDYSRLSSFSLSFKHNLKRAMKKYDVELLENKELDDGTVIPYYFEKNAKCYALRFFYGEEEMNSVSAYQLPCYIYQVYKIKTVNLYFLPYLVYQDLTVLSLFGNISQVLARLKEKENDLSSLPEEQRRMRKYFKMLEDITLSFPPFASAEDQEKRKTLCSSSLDNRPLINITPKEVSYGILSYLSHFTYLSRTALLREISQVIGTKPEDVDFRLLFTKAEDLLLEEKKIKKDQGKLSLVLKQ